MLMPNVPKRIVPATSCRDDSFVFSTMFSTGLLNPSRVTHTPLQQQSVAQGEVGLVGVGKLGVECCGIVVVNLRCRHRGCGGGKVGTIHIVIAEHHVYDERILKDQSYAAI